MNTLWISKKYGRNFCVKNLTLGRLVPWVIKNITCFLLPVNVPLHHVSHFSHDEILLELARRSRPVSEGQPAKNNLNSPVGVSKV
jgi:hypothetical protein